MRTATASYMKLIKTHPLCPIRTDADYDAAVAVLDKLAVRGERDIDAGERDYLAVLSDLVAAYDDRRHDIPEDARPIHERLRSLMADSGMTPRVLARELDVSHSLVSLILSGKRALSKENVVRLAARFSLDAGYFLPPIKTMRQPDVRPSRRVG